MARAGRQLRLDERQCADRHAAPATISCTSSFTRKNIRTPRSSYANFLTLHSSASDTHATIDWAELNHLFCRNRLGGGARDLFAILRRLAGTEGASAPPPAPRWRDREFSPDCQSAEATKTTETTDTCPRRNRSCRHRDRVREGAPAGPIRRSETVFSGDVARPVDVAPRRIQDPMDLRLVRRVRCAPEQREQNPNAPAAFYRSLTINQITRLRSLTIHKTLQIPGAFCQFPTGAGGSITSH